MILVDLSIFDNIPHLPSFHLTCLRPWILARCSSVGETCALDNNTISIHQEANGAALTLSHICPIDDHWRKYGPAAVGIGWDLSLLGLGLHLSRPDGDRFDEEAFAATAEGKATLVGLSESCRDAAIASGDEPTLAEQAARMTAAFYSGS